MNQSKPLYHGYRFPAEIISHSIWLYHRFCLSFRDVEDILAERGIIVSYESIRNWCNKFGSAYARSIKKNRGSLGDTWYLDEVFIRIDGKQYYLWRAVDQECLPHKRSACCGYGDVVDILMQKRKDKCAAARFFKKLMKGQGCSARQIVTDKLPSYGAAKKEVMPSSMHCSDRYENNRAEVSHEHTRSQERQMSNRPPNPDTTPTYLALEF